MSIKRVFAAGYTDLVSVVPPRAELAPTTKLKPSSRGKVPGRPRRDGQWVGYRWTDEPSPTLQDLDTWEQVWKANVGLRADRFPGLDIDVDHPTLAAIVQKVAEETLGLAPIRLSRDSRRLLVYRAEEPISKMAATIVYKGEEHGVELLGAGSQYLIQGTHPSGSEYGFEGRHLSKWQPNHLPVITAEKVMEFFRALREKLDGHAEVLLPGESRKVQQADGTVVEKVAKGDRNNRLASLAGTLQHNGLAQEAIVAQLLVWNQERCDPPLPEEEVRAIAESITSRYQPDRDMWEAETPAEDEFQAVPGLVPPVKPSLPGPTAEVIEFSDNWVVHKLASLLSDRVRYVPETGRWHIWE
jgi:hypothetical protein